MRKNYERQIQLLKKAHTKNEEHQGNNVVFAVAIFLAL